MTIHKEGYIPILYGFIIVLVFSLVFGWLFAPYALWHLPVYSFFGLLLIWIVLFFRSPRRRILINPLHVISPADGKIVQIKEVQEQRVMGQTLRQVSIFMSPFNVHLNRYPLPGKVMQAEHYPGKYLLAWHPKSSELNERTTIVMESGHGRKIMLSQVAGFVARRIVCYAKEGMQVEQGSELGFIKFGSRVDLFVPLDFHLNVTIGDKVKGGVSIIATQAENPDPYHTA